MGGSILIGEQPRVDVIKAVGKKLEALHQEGHRLVLVCGGGVVVRHYVNAMRELGANNFEMDIVGINLTRVNAQLLIQAIPSAHVDVLTAVRDAQSVLDTGKIPIFGGLMPGFTTDSVGALIAEYLGAEFVNLTNIDGIYDSDPKKNPDAKRYETISYADLVQMISKGVSQPGQNVVLDLVCCMILQRSRIPAVVLDGKDLENLEAFVKGKPFKGTKVRD